MWVCNGQVSIVSAGVTQWCSCHQPPSGGIKAPSGHLLLGLRRGLATKDVLVVGLVEELAAGNACAQLDAGQVGTAQLAMQRVSLLRWSREPMAQHHRTCVASDALVGELCEQTCSTGVMQNRVQA